ncbi:MAG: molybdenum cofactor biosynthesis protein MoaE [Thermoanaerobaculia bacterium]|nr:molybdenum cofactor biosynthesis protein MoaE [Thermoanaerobaculia bacterium]
MKIRLLAFASAADALGAGELEVELPDGVTAAGLRGALVPRHPALEPIWDRLAVAVEGRVVGGDEPIPEGAEVALLPPVSGGGPEATRLTDDPIDVARVERSAGAAAHGAVLLFVGRVRDHHRGRAVQGLTYHAYRPMAERAMARIARELESGSPGLAVVIEHRLGRLAPGETSVAIAVASPHREEAYRASRAALERLKREVPIWKREQYADGERVWREEERLAPAPGG